MQENWECFWQALLDNKKLNSKVSELNIIDGSDETESICRKIYNKYDEHSKKLESIRLQFVQEIEHLPGVHLQTSRVKSIESLLEKVINKRHENLLNKDNLYAKITSDNYREIITDLVGVRIIIGYRGEWSKLHNEILKKFPYKNSSLYSENYFIPHEDNKQFIAEVPKVYYSIGDDLSQYKDSFVKLIIKTSGYRSVHYVISFMNTYIELQARTIYDEAWSDCDHRYVYKHEENKSHAALLVLSNILSVGTNASDDLGDLMHLIFSTEDIIDIGDGTFSLSDPYIVEQIDSIAMKFKNSFDKLDSFRKLLRRKEE